MEMIYIHGQREYRQRDKERDREADLRRSVSRLTLTADNYYHRFLPTKSDSSTTSVTLGSMSTKHDTHKL